MFIIIAAIGKNNELGKNNNLIWHLPNDLKFFKEKTMNHPILMGRNTFESLPKLLPNRKHIVLSRGKNFPDEVKVYSSIEEFLNSYEENEDIFIIGGAQVYRQMMPYANSMYLTHIDAEDLSADVYFPEIVYDDWEQKTIGENSDNGIQYKHVLYKRRKY